MKSIRTLIRKIPGTLFLYHQFVALKYRFQSKERVFTNIYHGNRWGGTVSRSGTGSDPDQTKSLVQNLPALMSSFHVSSMLDIPCGDFLWMKQVDLENIEYIGGDIVEPLINDNIRLYSRDNRSFRKMNIIEDNLPKVDMIFCRDCLVHFSYRNIQQALKNIFDSNSEFLFVTTFDAREHNTDIVTGKWRPLNLMAPPFNFPEPLLSFDEECTEADGAYRDKKRGLWRISDLKRLIFDSPA